MGFTCGHVQHTLIDTEGLGTWQVVEVYRCNECGAVTRVPVETDTEEQ